ncbi:TPA_asm: M [Glehnia littoralis virus 1]|uniref:M n=1 Tax=Glehnia littoralis virus 1 TaxID=2793728 RepID=A0A8D9PH90_9RHAB|nr:M [Glehnia littoralis virus 1] [Glehnia littoralis virus 1]DAF42324.1 TPA_asm: M [Glehnia littoralis virus 1]
MSTFWFCAAILTKNAELEFANRKTPKSFKSGSVRESFNGLLAQMCKGDKEKCAILRGLVRLNRVSSVRDIHTSSFFGPRTCRIQYLFSPMNVFPAKVKIAEGKTTLCSSGLTTLLEGTKIRANVCVDLVITAVDSEKIDELLIEHPEWFSGEIDDLNCILGKIESQP